MIPLLSPDVMDATSLPSFVHQVSELQEHAHQVVLYRLAIFQNAKYVYIIINLQKIIQLVQQD